MKRNQTDFLKLCLADALIKLMKSQEYESINVNSICAEAVVGRTTFYRYFGRKNSKQELLQFKLLYEWESYKEKHGEEFARDKTYTLLNFIYENKNLFLTLNENGVVSVTLCLFEEAASAEYASDKPSSYLKSFFVYGQFGVVHRWIEYAFDEPPEQLQKHIVESILSGYTLKNAK